LPPDKLAAVGFQADQFASRGIDQQGLRLRRAFDKLWNELRIEADIAPPKHLARRRIDSISGAFGQH
jgi:hypothetical protein